MISSAKSVVYLLAVFLIGSCVQLADASHTIDGILPYLNITQFGSAWKDPCSESWSNDIKPDYPCPTANPTPSPTAVPTTSPTPGPSASPTASPSATPTTSEPTESPSAKPTTASPTSSPTSSSPTMSPTKLASDIPSAKPTTASPTASPTARPTNEPTTSPSATPTIDWAAATTISKTDLCRSAPLLPEDAPENQVLTKVTFYYTVETTPDGNPDDFLPPLENALLQDVARDVFLPCEEETRKLKNKKKGNLRKKQPRFLEGSDVSITVISSNPEDTELTQFSCTPKVAGNKCFVIQGDMTVMHHDGDDPADIESVVLESVKETMGDDSLTTIDTVEDVVYLGTSFDEVKASLGPEETLVEYYYTVETKPGADPDAFTAAIEDGILESVTRDVADASVGGISSEPVDLEMTEYSCFAETKGNDCYVYKGEMTVLHDGSGSEEVIKDAVLASIEGSMTSGELADSIDDVEKVTYVGESLDDLKASLGPEETLVEYYYTVEALPGADPDAFTAAIEDGILESVTRDVADASVGAISSEPVDLELTEYSCFAETKGNDCYVYKGEMTVLHDGSGSEEVIKDAVLASIEGSMTSGELADSIDDVEKVTYVGESLDDLKASLGPEETLVEYYYTVEALPGADPDAFTAAIEDGILESVTRDVADASVGAISSEPVDLELTEYSCFAETKGNDCYVYKGEMTVLHDGSGSEEVIKDAVLASIEGSMTSGELADSIDDVEKVTYVGESLDDLKASLGPEETLVEYYYTVEALPGADPDAFTAAIEDGILESVTRDVADASVGAISSEPLDSELTIYDCEPETAGNDCYVYKGEMTVLHDGSGSEEVIKDAVLASIEGSMTSGELADSIDDVEKVTYLGDSLEDVTAALGPPFNEPPVIGKIQGNTIGQDDDDDENNKKGVIIGACLAAAFIALLALLVHRRRSQQIDESKGLALDSFDDGELDEDALNQNYDSEPGSFHLGQFHYTKDGRRYLSAACELCRANSAFNLERDGSFIRANSKDLGGKHSAHDVHVCTSATCIRCQNGTPGQVEFIKTGDATFCQPIDEELTEDFEENSASDEASQKQSRPSKFAFWRKK